jgi:hypothetical protein
VIVYSGTKSRFRQDVMTNDIGGIIATTFKSVTGHSTKQSEINSWVNSLQYMDRVLEDPAIPATAGVAIEYHIPRSSKRIDFILTGTDAQHTDTAILVELKQWQQADLTAKDGIVVTTFKGGPQETPHPSYQAWTYKRLLQDYNATVQEEKINLYPCAYLHNYAPDNTITNPFYAQYTKEAPVFLKPDALKLQEFIKRNIRHGDRAGRDGLLYRIDNGKIKPSKNLADSLAGMLRGNQEFVMVDDQKIVYETALAQARQAATGQKHVLIVEGGPGTGKSVVAINLLVELTKQDMVAQYVTRNSAPRLVYAAKLAGTLKRNRIDNMFRSSETFHKAQPNEYDCLIVDEAHRLKEKSGMFGNLGENQVKELINAAKLAVFFIDEDQKVTLKDIGDKEEIRRWAKKHAAIVTELKLESQFRCNGSDGYLAWLDYALGIAKASANDTLDTGDYDFRVLDDPAQLHALIRQKNTSNKARVVAGYCWPWLSKKDPRLKDIVIGAYQAAWNLTQDGQTWIIQPASVSEVGCIHTCQGLELDYVGVIVGPDLIVRAGEVLTAPGARAGSDRSIHGWKALAQKDPAAAKLRLDAIIKNTYRTLMTRGLKGCYVHFTDEETARHFKALLAPAPAAQAAPAAAALKVLYRIEEEVAAALKFTAYLPVFSLQAACGNFGRGMAVEPLGWIKCPPGLKPDHNMFAAQVAGRSMEPKLQDGDYCVFRANPGGSRQNKLVLVQHSSIADPDTGGSYTVKKYTSKKKYAPDGAWQHEEIILQPLNPAYSPIVIPNAEDEEFMVVAELISVLASQEQGNQND